MRRATIDVQTPDGTADCYLTRPSDDGGHPAVLSMIDAIGYTMSDMAVFDEAACERHFEALGALLSRS